MNVIIYGTLYFAKKTGKYPRAQPHEGGYIWEEKETPGGVSNFYPSKTSTGFSYHLFLGYTLKIQKAPTARDSDARPCKTPLNLHFRHGRGLHT